MTFEYFSGEVKLPIAGGHPRETHGVCWTGLAQRAFTYKISKDQYETEISTSERFTRVSIAREKAAEKIIGEKHPVQYLVADGGMRSVFEDEGGRFYLSGDGNGVKKVYI